MGAFDSFRAILDGVFQLVIMFATERRFRMHMHSRERPLLHFAWPTISPKLEMLEMLCSHLYIEIGGLIWGPAL